MRLVIDLFPCQTKFRHRGIGRYTLSLAIEMAVQRRDNDMIILADPLMPESFEELRRKFIRLLPSGNFLPYYHTQVEFQSWENYNLTDKIAQTLITQAYNTISPDCVLSPSLFEGIGEIGSVPLPVSSSYKKAVILYDLIPYIFREQYLDPNPDIKDWYIKRLNFVSSYDLILAISESTRKDAIDILKVNPNKIVNISGAASSIFRKLEIPENEKQDFLNKYNIKYPFVLYIGGDDFRKNMEGALIAYSKLPHKIKTTHQLVLNDVGDKLAFREKARKLGLSDNNLVVTGRVNDDDLVKLYNLCKLSIFPSKYEGFGLPILEAMACGAPVIASNNSSIPEIVGRRDLLFDASDNESIVEVMQRTLTNDQLLDNLSEYSLRRSKEFSWKNTAISAWKSFESINNHPKENIIFNFNKKDIQKPSKIAYVSPLPPHKSGVAEYSAALLPYLEKYFDLDIYTEPGINVTDPQIFNIFNIYPWTELQSRYDIYDTYVYHIGNSEYHTYMVDLLQKFPGVIVTHDFFLNNIPFVMEYVLNSKNAFVREIYYSHGLLGVVDFLKNDIDSSRLKWPANWRILKNAQELIVHSPHQIELTRKYYSHGWIPRPTIIKQIREVSPPLHQSARISIREELGFKPDNFIFCSFGLMAKTKLNNPTIQAFYNLIQKGISNVILVFVGPIDDGEYGKQTLDLIEKYKIQDMVFITGYKFKEEYEKYLLCADAAIQLRMDSRGETSRAVLDCLAFGIPTIINSHGSLNDYDSSVVIKLTEFPSIDEISDAMNRIYTDMDFRSELHDKAQKIIAEEFNPEIVARQHAEVIMNMINHDERRMFAPIVQSLYKMQASDEFVHLIAKSAALNLDLRVQTRLLLDVTNLDSKKNSIKSIISKIIVQFFETKDLSTQMEIVEFNDNNDLCRAVNIINSFFGVETRFIFKDDLIKIQPGDTLISFISSDWKHKDHVIYRSIREKGGKILAIVLEKPIEPISLANTAYDGFICVSRIVAKKLMDIAIRESCNNIFYIDKQELSGIQLQNTEIDYDELIDFDWCSLLPWFFTELKPGKFIKQL